MMTTREHAIKLGLWGCGGRTRQILEATLPLGLARVSCCYDIDPARSRALAAWSEGRVVDSADALLADPGTDAFLISLYPGLHAQAILQALPAGKPIYVEKPVATNWADYQALAAVADRVVPPVHVGLMHRYNPFFAEVARLVGEGRIGRLVGSATNWLTRLRPVEGFPGGRNDWHFREDTGGELIQHFCHVFDWMRVLGGDFTSVTATQNHLLDTDLPIEDTWNISLQYASGALAHFHSSMRNPLHAEMGWIEGSEGSLEWEWSRTPRLLFYENTCVPKPAQGHVLDMPDMKTAPRDVVTAFSRFAACVRNGTPPDVSLRDGLWSVLVGLAARKSAAEGCRLNLP